MSGFTHEPPAGGSAEWYTPPGLFSALDLDFDLDPCAPPPPAAPWIPATQRYSLPDDGMALPWSGRVWLNPPYGVETARWVGRLGEHGDGVALVFTRVDTPWAQSALRLSDAVCFLRGRVNFIAGPGANLKRGDSRAGAPSMLIAFGAECAAALLAADLGITFAGAVDARQLDLEAAA